MALYYDERAAEYDEVYSGGGPAIPTPGLYKEDVDAIIKMARRFGTGFIIDIGCGTGFWLPHYAGNCAGITLLDQSMKMLAQCKERTKKFGIIAKCNFLHSDFFNSEFEAGSFDSAVVGFFISHLTDERMESFFQKLNEILKSGAELLIIDSAWSELRQKYRRKEEIQKRTLKDGREFDVFKRYMSSKEVEEMVEQYGYHSHKQFYGHVFQDVAAIRE
jgi:ubiquinone/menaquinone biosynthesis C-methylase UbiE